MSTIPETATTALGDGEPLTDDQVRLLGILLAPENDPWAQQNTVEEAVDEFADFTGMDTYEDRMVAERLREHFNRIYGWGAFDFELIHDAGDACVTAYNVLLHVAGEGSLYLATSDDIRYLGGGREEVSGLRAALNTAEAIEGDWLRLRAAAQRLGLPLAQPASPAPAAGTGEGSSR